MSRIGKIPVAIPSGVTVSVDGDTVHVKGPKGELTRELTGGITAVVEENQLRLERPDDEAQSKALHGLYRSLCNGMVEGVDKGYEKRLEVVGVSYQASVEGNRLRLQVGFSHPVFVDIPKGLTVECPSATTIVIKGCDKQMVGEFAAKSRKVRPPEPYKGKGVRYVGEQIIQKAGKSFVGGEK
ncbi:MAG: 50S ribosomal protein L6 [Planctomycetota bacterium]|nr:50S ribosomal protein L6 [Planctomycetota bacterium]